MFFTVLQNPKKLLSNTFCLSQKILPLDFLGPLLTMPPESSVQKGSMRSGGDGMQIPNLCSEVEKSPQKQALLFAFVTSFVKDCSGVPNNCLVGSASVHPINLKKCHWNHKNTTSIRPWRPSIFIDGFLGQIVGLSWGSFFSTECANKIYVETGLFWGEVGWSCSTFRGKRMLLLLQFQLEPKFSAVGSCPEFCPCLIRGMFQVRPFISTKKIQTLPTTLFMNKIQRLTVNIVEYPQWILNC